MINHNFRGTARSTGSISNFNSLSTSDYNSPEVSFRTKKSKLVVVSLKSAVNRDHVIDMKRIIVGSRIFVQ